MTPAARRGDPATSHDAAASLDPLDLGTIRGRVLALLRLAPEGLTHDQLISAYRRQAFKLGWPNASDSSIRTRCSELAKDGEVGRAPDLLGRTRSGRGSIIWRAVVVQNSKTEG